MDDEKVVARFLETGDRAMFGVLVERYQDRVFRLVASVLGPYSGADAEEVSQEVFLRLYRKIRQFTGQAGFGTWLYRIAYNLAIDWRRRARFRLPHVSIEEIRGLASSSDPLEDVLTKETKDLVVLAMEDLPDLYRTTLYMHYWLERPVEEIAELMGIPEGTVKSQLFRARKLLKDKLGRILGKTEKDGRPS
jgi:RNA polymerase sigma-70 factor (ECF subfamily)